MQYGSRCDLPSGISMRICKAKLGEPYRNWTRLKHQDYVKEVGFFRLLVRKIRRALGPIYLDFFAPSAIFLRKWLKGASWTEPLGLYKENLPNLPVPTVHSAKCYDRSR